MPTPITLTTGADTVTVTQGPSIKINTDPYVAWNDQVIDGSAGFDTLVVDESSTKASYFTVAMTHDGIVTLTAASGAGSKYVSIKNFEKISFWDVTMNLGTAGNDTLTGTAISESVYGFDGNDTLDGGTGTKIDKLFGGAGNDTYIVAATNDIISELAPEGTDTVKASATYSLADTDGIGFNGGNIENLTLTGVAAINGTGNALNNILTGNGAVNTLIGDLGNDTIDGGGGADTMAGGAGNDSYYVDQTTDVITELKGGGIDSVKSSVTYTLSADVDNLTLTGTAAINATGNIGKNVLVGNKGANLITGGKGQDIMTGGLGADTFDFNSTVESAATLKHDQIKDFVHLTDKIDLSTIDANSTGTGNAVFTFLEGLGTAFTPGTAGQVHFVTSGTNTMIEGDTNGDAIADFQIELTGTVGLTGADFIL